MLFESPHANLTVNVSKERLIRHPVTGDVIEKVPAVRAQFGNLGPEFEFINPETNEVTRGAHITGHFFDTEEEAIKNGWDADVKAMVERRLLALCQQQPEIIKQIVQEKPKAKLPWATYDGMDAAQVVSTAQATGLVDETLAYERENAKRPAVLDALTGPSVEDEPEADLEPAAVKAKKPEPAVAAANVIEV